MAEDLERYNSSLTGAEVDVALQDMANHISERYAKGTANGVPVTSGQVGYNDNSKYYAQQAKTDADRAQSAVPIGTESAVLWTMAQSLTDSAKQVARNNIGAGNPLGTVAGGKNLLNLYASQQGLLNDGIFYINNNWLTTDFIEVQGGQAYVGSIESATDNYVVRFHEYDASYNFLRNMGNPLGVNGNTTKRFDLLSNTKYVRISYGRNNKVTTVADYVNGGHWLQLELGNTATPFEPYYESNLMLTQKVNWDLLWTNASPSTAFAEQTLSLSNLNLYKRFAVEIALYNNSAYNLRTTQLFLVEYGKILNANLINTINYIYKRLISFNDDSINVLAGQVSSPSQSAVDNSALIPLKIYGIR